MEYHVPSVALAARVLKLLSRYKYKSCTQKEIADALHVNKTTCLRVLKTLEREDFIRYDASTRRYSLGPYLIPLGNRAMQMIDSVAVAAGELEQVAQRTGLTTVLVERLRDDRLIYIAAAEPPRQEVRISVSVGQQYPVTVTAFGKCFLAYDDEEKIERLIRGGLPKYTSNTVVDPDVLLADLARVRRNGYAISHGEAAEGISAIAAPVFNRDGRVEFVLACLSVSSWITEEITQATLQVVRETTAKLSEWNGYHQELDMIGR
ncbi:IclR family transcriptional regulator [Alicyclobacillus cycloheptanicus]|uniref:DNA-binding IclR family transcriptional regulator n=1 Tax=Alicyclobacillus cycloheptanicus TaxID=1457 RepID=A0ABT9XF58_9BACL|nr:IclR family transcriptional regulator [Alicyclobacillus cycloheptanicus]MDQ0188937.1 DNA-binding IclR family transcriptional regulator [Alicyclobacillus cycloheptanicus]WDM01714.1 IclR family transcriptional regulator [Alicyclobacillus cycloheptanicus]